MAVATSRGRGMSAKELKLVVRNLNTVKRGWREGEREGEREGGRKGWDANLHVHVLA